MIGLTGGIGTGKSTVESIFQELGAYVIDADKVVHLLYTEEDVKEKIRQLFGEEVFSEKEVDRKKISKVVFSDTEKRRALEQLMHPKVERRIKDWLEDLKEKDKDAIVIVSVPLMIETGSYKRYEKVVLVYAPREKQIERLLKKGYTLEEAINRIEAQMDIEEKLKFADYVIMNTSTIQNLRKEVEKVFNDIKKDP
ncbi:MAG: dephospho-CoA kinase [Hydrogenothermaceae bacterium]|nr:dephospho-CoA kinase [Hydrogenothermaceae bacterium]